MHWKLHVLCGLLINELFKGRITQNTLPMVWFTKRSEIGWCVYSQYLVHFYNYKIPYSFLHSIDKGNFSFSYSFLSPNLWCTHTNHICFLKRYTFHFHKFNRNICKILYCYQVILLSTTIVVFFQDLFVCLLFYGPFQCFEIVFTRI